MKKELQDHPIHLTFDYASTPNTEKVISITGKKVIQ